MPVIQLGSGTGFTSSTTSSPKTFSITTILEGEIWILTTMMENRGTPNKSFPIISITNIASGYEAVKIGTTMNYEVNNGYWESWDLWYIIGPQGGDWEISWDDTDWPLLGQGWTQLYATGFSGADTSDPFYGLVETQQDAGSGITQSSSAVVTLEDYARVFHNGWSGNLQAGSDVGVVSPLTQYGGAASHRGGWRDTYLPGSYTDIITLEDSSEPFGHKAFAIREAESAGLKLDLRFDEVGGSQVTVDSTGRHTPTMEGDAVIDSDVFICGTGSLKIPDVDSYVSIPDSDDFKLGVSLIDHYSISAWIKLNDLTKQNPVWTHAPGPPFSIYGMQFGYNNSGVYVIASVGGATVIQMNAGLITDNGWHWIAFCKVLGEYGIYLDGIQVGYDVETTVLTNIAADILIGNDQGINASSPNETYWLDGWIDELKYRRDNSLGAAPNVGLTDTIAIPSCSVPLEIIEPVCSYVGEVATSVANLDHLEGETVAILANGEVLDQQVVSDGAVVLGGNYSVVHVGLPYNSDLETLNINFDRELGSIQGSQVKIGNAMFRLRDSRGGWIGPDSDNLYEAFTQQSLRESSGQDLEDIELFTGDVRQPLGSEYKNGGRVFFRQVDPLPVTIGAIVPEVAVGGPAR